MSDIKFLCPHCDGSLIIDARGAGLTVSCTHCGTRVIVPAPHPDTPGDSAIPQAPHPDQAPAESTGFDSTGEVAVPAPTSPAPAAVSKTFHIVFKGRRELRPYEWRSLKKACAEVGVGPFPSRAEAETRLQKLQRGTFGELCNWQIQERE